VKKLKNILAIVMALMMVIAVSSCSEKKEAGGTQKVGDFEFGKDELTFSWYTNMDYYVATPWADTSQTEKWIKENLKVNITYIDAGGAPEEKLATMIVSNDFPDLITMLRGQESQKLIDMNKIVSINDFMNKHTVMRDAFKEGRIFELIKNKDNKNYEIPNWANESGKPNGNNIWAINMGMYKELGSPKLETFDDLYNYLKMVKNKYPNSVPYETTSTFQGERYVLPGMAEDLTPDNLNFYSYVDNGKLVSIFKHPAYRETMLYLSKLFREKLIPQDALSQTTDQVTEKYRNSQVAVTSAALSVFENTRADLQKVGSDWQGITPPMKSGLDRKRVYSQGFDRSGWTEMLITKNAKNPEGIYAYLDWLYSPEGQTISYYGPSGIYWDGFNEKGFPNFTQKYFDCTPEEWKGFKGNGGGSGLGNTTFVDGKDAYLYYLKPNGKHDWHKEQQINKNWPYARDITEFAGIIPGTSTDEGIIYQSITDLHSQARAKMLFAKSDEEVITILDQLIAETDKTGMDRLLSKEETIWKENRKRLALD